MSLFSIFYAGPREVLVPLIQAEDLTALEANSAIEEISFSGVLTSPFLMEEDWDLFLRSVGSTRRQVVKSLRDSFNESLLTSPAHDADLESETHTLKPAAVAWFAALTDAQLASAARGLQAAAQAEAKARCELAHQRRFDRAFERFTKEFAFWAIPLAVTLGFGTGPYSTPVRFGIPNAVVGLWIVLRITCRRKHHSSSVQRENYDWGSRLCAFRDFMARAQQANHTVVYY